MEYSFSVKICLLAENLTTKAPRHEENVQEPVARAARLGGLPRRVATARSRETRPWRRPHASTVAAATVAPGFRDLSAYILSSQRYVTGTVRVKLFKGARPGRAEIAVVAV